MKIDRLTGMSPIRGLANSVDCSDGPLTAEEQGTKSAARRWFSLSALVSCAIHAALIGLLIGQLPSPEPITLTTGEAISVDLVFEAPSRPASAASVAKQMAVSQPEPQPVERALDPREVVTPRQVPDQPIPEKVEDKPEDKPEAVEEEAVIQSVEGALPVPERVAETAAKPEAVRPTEANARPKPSEPVRQPTSDQPQSEHSHDKPPETAKDGRDQIQSPAQVASDTSGQNQTARPSAGNPRPDYPASAIRRKLEGRVILKVEVLPSGRAGDVLVYRSSGYGILDRAAVKGVKRWRFIPAKRAGQPTATRVKVPVRFELQSS